MWNDFKKFAVRGNVIDLAVGVVVGNAFTKIVNSLVNDIIMPFFGFPLGKINLSNLFIQIGGDVNYKTIEDAKAAGIATINYGLFLNNILNFLIIAFSIYLIVKQINRIRTKLEKNHQQQATSQPVTTKVCPHCFSTINIKATRCPNCTSDLKIINEVA